MSAAPLRVLYEDEALVIVDKPPKVLVHRSALSPHDYPLMWTLRDQIGRWVYPAHRLDRATSGAIAFTTSPEHARALALSFERREVEKRYWALTRGYAPDEAEVHIPLKEPLDEIADALADPNKSAQEAHTSARCLARVELPIAVGRYPTTRYSLVEAIPHTGRRHQIRRHLHHLTHPIIGDTSYGRTEHNRLFRESFSCDRLLLAAVSLTVPHPVTGAHITARAPLSGDFERVVRALFPALSLTLP